MTAAVQPALKSEFLRVLSERGYIHQATDLQALDSLAAVQVVPGYIGFDATAPSLHVGSLIQIMMLRRLQQAGHRPIVVMGGGTTKVGDPTGRDESRKLLTEADIAANIAGIKKVFERFLHFGDRCVVDDEHAVLQDGTALPRDRSGVTVGIVLTSHRKAAVEILTPAGKSEDGSREASKHQDHGQW